MIVKRFLFILSGPPEDEFRSIESLDMVLTTAAFEQPAALLFLEEGVRRLLPESSERPGAPNVKLLDMYDIETVWVERESLAERGVAEADLPKAATLVARAEIPALIASRDVVVNT